MSAWAGGKQCIFEIKRKSKPLLFTFTSSVVDFQALTVDIVKGDIATGVRLWVVERFTRIALDLCAHRVFLAFNIFGEYGLPSLHPRRECNLAHGFDIPMHLARDIRLGYTCARDK